MTGACWPTTGNGRRGGCRYWPASSRRAEPRGRGGAGQAGEETGITVGQVRYLGSQPWPMPRSLMLGFRAQASGDLDIHVDRDEIAEARWFSREDLRRAMAANEVLLPPAVSIAHRIIESWYGEKLSAAR